MPKPERAIKDVVEPVPVPVPAPAESPKPIVIMSELDSYISERMKSQPATLEDVLSDAEAMARHPKLQHRLVLPDYFEDRSYDHVEQRGPFVFRWILKDKRAIDPALNVRGWKIVNRTYFPDAPRHLFTASGGVELGDLLLMFMPAKQALVLRAAPGQRSLERLEGQLTKVEDGKVMMTGNPENEHLYMPKLPKEEEEDHAPAGTAVSVKDVS